MTREDIIKMAREAGFIVGEPWREMLIERFFRMAQAAEREKFIKYPEGNVVGPCICGSWPGGKCLRCSPTKEHYAAIRARGQA